MLLVVTAYICILLLKITSVSFCGKECCPFSLTWGGMLLVVAARNNSQISLKNKTTFKLTRNVVTKQKKN